MQRKTNPQFRRSLMTQAVAVAVISMPAAVWAATGSCANVFEVISPATGQCTLDTTNDTLHVLANGSISAQGSVGVLVQPAFAGPGVQFGSIINENRILSSTTDAIALNMGVGAGTTGTISTISNSGTIAGAYGITTGIATAAGIHVISGDVQSIINNGLITGYSEAHAPSSAGAVQLDANAHVVSISNSSSGTIGGLGGAYGISNNNGSINSIDNSGTISAVGDTADAIYNIGHIGTISNSGTIIGSGTDTYGINNAIDATTGVIDGIYNSISGRIISSSSTAIYNEGNITFDIGNDGTISGGTYGIDNLGTIGGNIANTGLINADANDVIHNSGTITGNITNANTATIRAAGNAIFNDGASASMGSIRNDGTISGGTYAIRNDLGTIGGNIVNTGTINADANDAIYNSGTITGNITNTNTATIRAAGNAIFNDGASASMGGISNDGTISGGAYAIHNSLGTINGPVANTGVISAEGQYAIYNDGTINGDIINSGTIRAGSVDQYAIYNHGVIQGVVNNSGLIDGRVELGGMPLSGTTLNLDGPHARVTGEVTGAPSTTVNVNGTFTTENTFDVGTFNINQGATLNMAHSIAAAGGGFHNDGTLNVGSNTVTVTGDYFQSGMLSIDANSAGQHGAVVVQSVGPSGINLAPTANFNVNVTPANSLTSHDSLTVLSSTNGVVTGTVNNLAVSDNSRLIDFTAECQMTGGQCTGVNLVAYAASHTGVQNAVSTENANQHSGAAGVLDSLVIAGHTGTDMDNVLTALDLMTNDKQISNAVAQTLPLFNAGMNQVASNTLHSTNRVIQARQESNRGISSGDEFLGDRKLWFKMVGSKTRQDTYNGVAGYGANTTGFVAGADGEIDSANRIGVALSYMKSNVNGISTSSGNKASVDAYQLIAYGSHTLANMSDTEVSWQADVGMNKNDGRRTIDFGGLNRTAQANYNSLTAHAGVGIARNYALSEKTTLTPAVRADYTWINDKGYTETGAGALNLQVNKHTADELILLAEGRMAHKLSDTTTLVANAGVGYDTLHRRNGLTASYVGGGAAFTTYGLDSSPWISRAGVGLTVNASGATEISARYDLESRSSGFLDQTASVKARWMF